MRTYEGFLCFSHGHEISQIHKFFNVNSLFLCEISFYYLPFFITYTKKSELQRHNGHWGLFTSSAERFEDDYDVFFFIRLAEVLKLFFISYGFIGSRK